MNFQFDDSLVSLVCTVRISGFHFFFFKWSNNRHTKQEKKQAIEQQIIGITDNVAVHQYVRYRLVYALQYVLQSLRA